MLCSASTAMIVSSWRVEKEGSCASGPDWWCVMGTKNYVHAWSESGEADFMTSLDHHLNAPSPKKCLWKCRSSWAPKVCSTFCLPKVELRPCRHSPGPHLLFIITSQQATKYSHMGGWGFNMWIWGDTIQSATGMHSNASKKKPQTWVVED